MYKYQTRKLHRQIRELRYMAIPGGRYSRGNSFITFHGDLGFTENDVIYIGYRACKKLLDSKPPYVPISRASGLIALAQRKTEPAKPVTKKTVLQRCNFISLILKKISKK